MVGRDRICCLLVVGLVSGLGDRAPARAGTPPTPAAADDAFRRAKESFESGAYAEALRAVEAAADALPPNAQVNLWELDFRGPVCTEVFVGGNRLYVVSSGQANLLKQSSLYVPDSRPVINDRRMRYDFNLLITCVDIRSGERCWSRQTQGRFEFAADPQDGGLYCWRRALLRLSPQTGEVEWQKALPEEGSIGGIAVGGNVLVPRLRDATEDGRDYPLRVWHLASGDVQQHDPVLLRWLAPDESRVLQVNRNRITCLALPDRKEIWQYRAASWCEAFWIGDDVVSLNCDAYVTGDVVRLDGRTGEVKWRTPMPWGAYRPGSDQLRNGSYARDDWRPIDVVAGQILAVDGQGTLHFLDPDIGKHIATASPSDNYMAFPSVLGDRVLICSQERVRAIPVESIFGSPGVREEEIALLKAACLHALDRTGEAMELVRPLMEQVPEFAPGWRLTAELARNLGLPFEEIGAECKYMSLMGQEVSSSLRGRFGLLRRIPTGSEIVARPIVFDSSIFIGTCNGWLYEIDRRSSEVVSRTRQERAITTLRARPTFADWHSDGSTICLLTIKERRWLLQIWSIDGKEKLREQVVVRPGQVEGDRGRLVPLHKGYLFSGGELTWLSRSAEVPPWRFGPGAEPGRAVPRPSDHVRPRYGVPVITNGLVFVACRDGGIYVFDALAITAPSRPVADTRVPSVHDG